MEKEVTTRYKRSQGYRNFLWTFNLENIDDFLQDREKNLHPLQIEELRNLVVGLNDFFEEESNMSIHDDHRVETYSSVALESTDILHATGQFHGKPMFSNVIVSAKDAEGNKTVWYGLVRKRVQTLINAYHLHNTYICKY